MAKNLQTVARRALTPCAGEHAFRFSDGQLARDLQDLRRRIAEASPHLVEHHREHYHHWIGDVLGDPALARKMARLAAQRRLSQDAYRREAVLLLDERIGKLRERVV
jgi:hypothetical protein